MDHPLVPLHRLGLSVIPVSRSKRPLVGWREYQQQCASPVELAGWVDAFPRCWAGIVTGAVSGLVVVDYDDTDVVPDVATMVVRTPRGFHAYYRHPGAWVTTRTGIAAGVDVRGDGGMVVAPGSDGYAIVLGSWSELAECPADLIGVRRGVRRTSVEMPRRVRPARMGFTVDDLMGMA